MKAERSSNPQRSKLVVPSPDSSGPSPITDEFHTYLITEYENIAEAHFRTIEAISSFFRYYLLIMSVPIALLSGFIGLSSDTEERLAAIDDLGVVLGAALTLISIVGFTVMLYVVNLRMDVILYARTVNAIRKHFYDQAEIGIEEKLRTRVLPQTPSQPAYEERVYFLPVILSFALLDTFYLLSGLVLLSGTALVDFSLGAPPGWVWAGAVLFPAHYEAYRRYAKHREHAYLRSYSIGVDIDGVLNKHRQHFSRLLQDKVGKHLDPDNITTIPLHDDPGQGVTREDERVVFNSAEYWADMPPLEGAAEYLARLKNAFRLKVHIFSHRAWPDLTAVDSRQRAETTTRWREAALALQDADGDPSWLSRLLNRARLWLGPLESNNSLGSRWRPGALVSWARSKLGTSPMSLITRAWLSKHGYPYDRLTVEQGNENVSDPEGHFRNRFYIARERKIRFFVEDDAEKAAKLAFICDVVFLLEQPYNQKPVLTLPNNVLRCRNWDEIYKQVRRLL
ncbi:MAG: hypothetical protein QME71_02875 [Dehalococcoidia bacterium]|nr:hypothetical protein [Dehalococcoidia bacterium]